MFLHRYSQVAAPPDVVVVGETSPPSPLRRVTVGCVGDRQISKSCSQVEEVLRRESTMPTTMKEKSRAAGEGSPPVGSFTQLLAMPSTDFTPPQRRSESE